MLARYGPPRRSRFPGAVQTWPRFGGAFFLSARAASGIFRRSARFSLSGLMQGAYSASARFVRASRGRPPITFLPVSLSRHPEFPLADR
ncbi:hypothetical protein EFD55_24440 [Rhizobium pisi]|uniref:Uncharacterized protein n=1 Tax=Rhizobium pisi TaxID=574561 RepID=A0A427MF91_9HYPH|nr:hypothetical protein EFD55_24440 [Rhizobium pisi]